MADWNISQIRTKAMLTKSKVGVSIKELKHNPEIHLSDLYDIQNDIAEIINALKNLEKGEK